MTTKPFITFPKYLKHQPNVPLMKKRVHELTITLLREMHERIATDLGKKPHAYAPPSERDDEFDTLLLTALHQAAEDIARYTRTTIAEMQKRHANRTGPSLVPRHFSEAETAGDPPAS